MTESGGKVLRIPRLEGIQGLVHGFGTRDWKEADFSRDPGLTLFQLVLMNQLHSDAVHVLRKEPGRDLDGDGLVTARPGVLLAVKTADCLPALLVDPRRKVVAAVHCGWRSTRKKILQRVVGIFRREFDSSPDDVIAAFGPCIGPECYEIGEDVRASFETSGFPARVVRSKPGVSGKFLLDLRLANAWLLREAGFRAENILSVERCTHCDPRLFSYRRDGDKNDRLFNFIGLIPHPFLGTRSSAASLCSFAF